MRKSVLHVLFIMGLLAFQMDLVAAGTQNQGGVSGYYSIGETQEGDVEPPLISNVSFSPRYPLSRDKVSITVTVTDVGSGVKEVKLVYWEDLIYYWVGEHWGWGKYEWMWWGLYVKTENLTKRMMKVGNTSTYRAELLELPYRTKVSFVIQASDNAGNIAVSNVYSYYVVRGAPSIILEEVNSMLEWLGYFSVLLILTIKVGGAGKKGKKSEDRRV
ncbi:MAG: hypothetical protein DRP00_03655 [Candidatus Aenigmatarchaeota archaeon]|nr:MAG: hypothetical protein DRP00_03655 [Candidatus Aenigmarchaeota archaeon]